MSQLGFASRLSLFSRYLHCRIIDIQSADQPFGSRSFPPRTTRSYNWHFHRQGHRVEHAQLRCKGERGNAISSFSLTPQIATGRAAVTARTFFTFDFRDNIDAMFALFASTSIRCWTIFIHKGYISEASIEEPGTLLSEEFTYTYVSDGRSI